MKDKAIDSRNQNSFKGKGVHRQNVEKGKITSYDLTFNGKGNQ